MYITGQNKVNVCNRNTYFIEKRLLKWFVHDSSYYSCFGSNGLFRQNLNGTGTGTIGFIEYYACNSHCSGTGTGNLTNGFPTHSGTYMVNLQVNLQGNLMCLYGPAPRPGPVAV